MLQEDSDAEHPRSVGPGNLRQLQIRNDNANPMPDHEGLTRVLELAIDDAQQTLRIVRKNAREWSIDPNRVGFMGTSAGGGVAFRALIEDKSEVAPDFVASLFGPSLMDVALSADTPPVFIVTVL